MDSRLVPWLPQVVYLRHYGSIFRNPLSNLRPVVFMGVKTLTQESEVISFKPALHKTNIADNVQELGGGGIHRITHLGKLTA